MRTKNIKKMLHHKKQLAKRKPPVDPGPAQKKSVGPKLLVSTKKNHDLNHEANVVRHRMYDFFASEYKSPLNNHGYLRPYYETGMWLSWCGVVTDVFPPSSGDLDGSILLNYFSYVPERSWTQNYLLDQHVWLKPHRIKFLTNTEHQVIGIGDMLFGKSKIISYTGNKTITKYGLGPTVIAHAGVFTDKGKILSNYDRKDDWVLQLSNKPLPKFWRNRYQEKKRVEVFDEYKGHVEVTYQPSKHDHYYDRLQEADENAEEIKKFRQITSDLEGRVKAFDFDLEDGQPVAKIFLDHFRDLQRPNFLPSTGQWFDYDTAFRKLGQLRQGNLLAIHVTRNKDRLDLFNTPTAAKVFLPESDPKKIPNNLIRYQVPQQTEALVGYLLAQKLVASKGYPQEADWLEQYRAWSEGREKPLTPQPEKPLTKQQAAKRQKRLKTMTLSELAKRLELKQGKVKQYLAELKILPSSYKKNNAIYPAAVLPKIEAFIKRREAEHREAIAAAKQAAAEKAQEALSESMPVEPSEPLKKSMAMLTAIKSSQREEQQQVKDKVAEIQEKKRTTYHLERTSKFHPEKAAQKPALAEVVANTANISSFKLCLVAGGKHYFSQEFASYQAAKTFIAEAAASPTTTAFVEVVDEKGQVVNLNVKFLEAFYPEEQS
ncbi:hypothetical protein [Lactobacillus corticis]|uniref:Uncharacterized protein n=1 Tax=Lactobacillus corticis TaxID=2201249 RepID=A0A916QFU5_9LACO|nr:hypothetical protein [Lactobacillus corticis]GFZ26229.1 hypothetical protein LCB40_01090 [Lactobacillus corticis]